MYSSLDLEEVKNTPIDYTNNTHTEYIIEYTPNTYILNPRLYKFPFFSALIETGERRFHLKLFEKEFVELNTYNELKLSPIMLIYNFDKLYELLNYFTHDEALEQLQQLKQLYEKEKSRIEKEVEKEIGPRHYYWNRISKGGLVSEEYLETNISLVTFEDVPLNKNIKDSFIEKYMYKIQGLIIHTMKNRSQKLIDLYLKGLIHNYDTSFTTHHLLILFENYILPVDFIERHIHTVAYGLTLKFYHKNTNLKEEFYEKYKNILNWSYISNINLSEEFFERNINLIDWYWFSQNNYISVEFFKKYINKLTWESLCKNENIPLELYEKNLDKLDWRNLSGNSSITLDFIKKHIGKMDMYVLCKRNLPESFFEEYINLLYFPNICENESISESFFSRYIYRITWNSIIYNKSVSDQFIKQHVKDFSVNQSWGWLVKNRSFDLLIHCIKLINGSHKDLYKQKFDNLPIKISKRLDLYKFILLPLLHPNNYLTEEIIEECIFEYCILIKHEIIPYKQISIINGMSVDFYKKYKYMIPLNIYENISLEKELNLVFGKKIE